MARVKNKTVLVTSAAQGIGRSCALALAREGAKVYATDINEIALKALEKEHVNIETFRLDVLKPEEITIAANKLGAIDILVNCSGFVHNGTILETQDADWDFSFDLNVKAHYRITKAYLPGMLEKGKGSIVNIASVASSIKGAPNRYVYGATKGAVIAMTKALAADFVGKGIRANAVCPGTVDTPSLHDRMKAQGDPEKARAAFIARSPMGRMSGPDEIASMVLYLACDESAFVTGQAFIIDGGWSL